MFDTQEDRGHDAAPMRFLANPGAIFEFSCSPAK
jgi:hypothetical protein